MKTLYGRGDRGGRNNGDWNFDKKEGNIDSKAKYAWSENSVWQDWRPLYGGVTAVKNGASGVLAGTMIFTNTLDKLHDFIVTPAAQGSVISFW